MEGSCLCGNLRYSISGDPVAKALCHCLDCRKISGSAYSSNAMFPDSGFKVVAGTPKEYTKKGDSGKTITSHFCGDCGSTLWRTGGSFPSLVILKAGGLDDIDALSKLNPVVELYTKNRVSWLKEIPGADQKTDG